MDCLSMCAACDSLSLNFALMAKDMAKLDDRLRSCAYFLCGWLPCTLHDMHDCNSKGLFFPTRFFFLISSNIDGCLALS